MGRYPGKADRKANLDRIEEAKEKYANKLKQVKGIYPEKDIFELSFDAQMYGERIQRLRKIKEMTIQHLADEIGATAATISKIENGMRKSFRIEYLYLICVVLETNPYYLLGKTDISEAIVFVTKEGDVKAGNSPISFYEKEVIELSDILTEMTNVSEEAYQKDKDLCKALVYILKYRNPEVRDRLKVAIKGICAICLTEEDWRQLKKGNGWFERI